MTPTGEVRLVPRGWLGMTKGYPLPVIVVDAGRSIVLRRRPPEHPAMPSGRSTSFR